MPPWIDLSATTQAILTLDDVRLQDDGFLVRAAATIVCGSGSVASDDAVLRVVPGRPVPPRAQPNW